MAEKKGKIVRIWREDCEVFAVEKLATPKHQGAGPRPYRLWHNGQPARGGQWHYSISGARWRVDYVMGQRRGNERRKTEAQITSMSNELCRLNAALEPFARFAEGNVEPDPDFEGHGLWTDRCQRERIVDWFGPTDFQKARDAFDGL